LGVSLCRKLKGHRNAKDQLLRASQAIPLNIDILQIWGALSAEDNEKEKEFLDRIVAMLTKLGQRGYSVHEGYAEYQVDKIDPDTDPDPDAEGNHEQADRRPLASGDGWRCAWSATL
jgi:hypothetical protein